MSNLQGKVSKLSYNVRKFIKLLILRIVAIGISTIFIFFCVPLGVLFLSPIYIYRQFVIFLAKIFKRNFTKILQTKSSIIASDDKIYTDSKWIITIAVYLEGKVDVGLIREEVEKVNNLRDEKSGQRIYPEMEQNISYFMGYPFWRKLEKEMNYGDLVHYYKNDENIKTNQEILDKATKEEYWFTPFTKDKPLWDFIVFPNFTPNPQDHPNMVEGKEYSVFVLRVHHALMDGYAVSNYAQRFCFAKNNLVQIIPRNYLNPAKGKGPLYAGFVLLKTILKLPIDATESLLTMLKYPWLNNGWEKNKVDKYICKNKVDRCFTNFTVSFPLQDLKDVKKEHPKINGITVAYEAIVEAVRQSMFKNGENIPKNMTVGVVLPVPKHPGTLRNHMTFGIILLPFSDMDRIERLYKIQGRFDKLRKSTMPIVSSIFMVLLGGLPRWIIRIVMWIVYLNDIIVTSNFAAPKNFTDVAGYPIKDFVPGIGTVVNTNILCIFMLSFNGMMKVSVTGDAKLFKSQKNARLFTDVFTQEIQNIKNAPRRKSHVVLEM